MHFFMATVRPVQPLAPPTTIGDERPMIWTLPNILTLGRLIAAPCVALVFVVFERPLADWLAFGIFVSAAVTDFLDGWLARKLNQTSQIGKMLDPIADKAMVIIVLTVILILFAGGPFQAGTSSHPFPGAVFTVPVVIIVVREILVSGLREFLGDVKLSVTPLAKWKTTAQMVAISLLLLSHPLWFGDLRHTGLTGDTIRGSVYKTPNLVLLSGIAVLWVAALLTLLSGLDYLRKGTAHIRLQEAR